jgi:HEAT repeat protein
MNTAVADALTILRRLGFDPTSPWTAKDAYCRVVSFGPEAFVPALSEALRSDEVDLVLISLDVISELLEERIQRPELISDVTGCLNHSHLSVRQKSLNVLAGFGSAAENAASRIQGMLDDESPWIVVGASHALLKISNAYRVEVEQTLLTLSKTEDPTHRMVVAETLGDCGPEILPALEELLVDKDHLVRSSASISILKITGDSTPAKAIADEMLNSEDWLDRQCGEEHLEEIERIQKARADQD